jgi:hypothetical protein
MASFGLRSIGEAVISIFAPSRCASLVARISNT